jgi:hypothetical protein
MRWAWHATCIEAKRNAHKILIGKREGRDNSEDPDADGRIIVDLMEFKI